jgi:hypothetical protein
VKHAEPAVTIQMLDEAHRLISEFNPETEDAYELAFAILDFAIAESRKRDALLLEVSEALSGFLPRVE